MCVPVSLAHVTKHPFTSPQSSPKVLLVLRSAVDEEDLFVGALVIHAQVFALEVHSRPPVDVHSCAPFEVSRSPFVVPSQVLLRGHAPRLAAAAAAASVTTTAAGGPSAGVLLSCA